MTKTKTSLWLAAAIAAGFTLGFAGCGDTNMPMTTTCTSDSQCAASEACHPALRRCVTACTGGADCGDSQKKCATFGDLAAGNDAGIRAFCQCATDELCGRAKTDDVCQPATKQCGAKCKASSDCPTGSTCDTATGKCGTAVVATDGGTDGGTTMDAGVTACTPGSCTAPQICTSGACAMPATCAAPMFQPGTCATGQQCVGTACAEVPFAPASCGNFMTPSTPRAWNPASSNGPIITEVAQLSFAVDQTFCGMGANQKRARMRIRAYDPSSTGRLTGETSQPSLRYYQTNGNSLAVDATQIQSYMSQNTGKNAEFIVNLCAPTAQATLVVGYAYDNGNPVCANLQ